MLQTIRHVQTESLLALLGVRWGGVGVGGLIVAIHPYDEYENSSILGVCSRPGCCLLRCKSVTLYKSLRTWDSTSEKGYLATSHLSPLLQVSFQSHNGDFYVGENGHCKLRVVLCASCFGKLAWVCWLTGQEIFALLVSCTAASHACNTATVNPRARKQAPCSVVHSQTRCSTVAWI